MLDLGRLVHAPGVVDPVTALLAQQAGFPALYLSGAAASAVLLGKADLGYIHGTDIAALASRITSVVDLPLIADADTGYGGVLQVARTAETYARAGVAALQLEDQVSPKRCGHLAGKEVLPLAEAVAKVRAAVDTQALMVVARTDALSVLGLDAALERARAYADAGADLVFVEGATTGLPLDRPQVLNRSEAGGETAVLPDEELFATGIRLVIHPVSVLLAMAQAARDTYSAISADGSAQTVPRLAWSELTDLLGQGVDLAREGAYL